MLSAMIKIVMKTFYIILIITIVIVVTFQYLPPVVTPLMIMRKFDGGRQHPAIRITTDWVPFEQFSPNLWRAIIAAEDQNFCRHWGFDIKAIFKAYRFNQSHRGKRIHGASTISMQTARSVYLWPGRNWLRKGIEIYITPWLELVWGKRRILEVYMNVVEWGDGLYGAEAASRKYFHKRARDLTETQAASLAAVLPNPRRWTPLRVTPYIRNRQAWILRQMRIMPPISCLR